MLPKENSAIKSKTLLPHDNFFNLEKTLLSNWKTMLQIMKSFNKQNNSVTKGKFCFQKKTVSQAENSVTNLKTLKLKRKLCHKRKTLSQI